MSKTHYSLTPEELDLINKTIMVLKASNKAQTEMGEDKIPMDQVSTGEMSLGHVSQDIAEEMALMGDGYSAFFAGHKTNTAAKKWMVPPGSYTGSWVEVRRKRNEVRGMFKSVHPDLFIGDTEAANDEVGLLDFGVRNVLHWNNDSLPESRVSGPRYKDIQHLWANGRSEFWNYESVNQYIHDCLHKGSVLFHCETGNGEGAIAILAAYIMAAYQIKAKEALKHMRQVVPEFFVLDNSLQSHAEKLGMYEDFLACRRSLPAHPPQPVKYPAFAKWKMEEKKRKQSRWDPVDQENLPPQIIPSP